MPGLVGKAGARHASGSVAAAVTGPGGEIAVNLAAAAFDVADLYSAVKQSMAEVDAGVR